MASHSLAPMAIYILLFKIILWQMLHFHYVYILVTNVHRTPGTMGLIVNFKFKPKYKDQHCKTVPNIYNTHINWEYDP